jgi:Zn-finger nucleic acid-binding protein
MICPKCDGVEMETVEVHSVKVDRCPVCEGTWYEQHELNVLKDQESNGDFRWLDGGLWQDAKKVAVDEKPRYTCPTDGAGLATVRYGDPEIEVDVCPVCFGIWLDKGEYDKLIERLADKVDGATFAEYLVDVEQEFVDLFTGEHKLKDEMADLGKVFYLLKLRFAAEHPVLIKIKEAIRNAFPGG